MISELTMLARQKNENPSWVNEKSCGERFLQEKEPPDILAYFGLEQEMSSKSSD